MVTPQKKGNTNRGRAVFVLSGYIVAGAAPGLAADVAVELGAIVCIIACIGGFIVAKVKANISL